MWDAWSSHEIWLYECQYCGTVWEEDFEVLHGTDGHGRASVVYRRDGHPSLSPSSSHACLNCHSENVYGIPYRRRPTVPRSRRGGDLEIVHRLRRLHAW